MARGIQDTPKKSQKIDTPKTVPAFKFKGSTPEKKHYTGGSKRHKTPTRNEVLTTNTHLQMIVKKKRSPKKAPLAGQGDNQRNINS